jgi:hypothetical protein
MYKEEWDWTKEHTSPFLFGRLTIDGNVVYHIKNN